MNPDPDYIYFTVEDRVYRMNSDYTGPQLWNPKAKLWQRYDGDTAAMFLQSTVIDATEASKLTAEPVSSEG